MNGSVLLLLLIFLIPVLSFVFFQDQLASLLVVLTKTKSVSFWASVSDQPVWLISQLRFVGLPPECLAENYNAYHDPLTFQDTGYCADVVCSNGTLKITGTSSSECVNLSKEKCSFGLLDDSTGLCVMNKCETDSDCGVVSQDCLPVCKPFGKGVFIPAQSKTVPAVSVCSCQ